MQGFPKACKGRAVRPGKSSGDDADARKPGKNNGDDAEAGRLSEEETEECDSGDDAEAEGRKQRQLTETADPKERK